MPGRRRKLTLGQLARAHGAQRPPTAGRKATGDLDMNVLPGNDLASRMSGRARIRPFEVCEARTIRLRGEGQLGAIFMERRGALRVPASPLPTVEILRRQFESSYNNPGCRSKPQASYRRYGVYDALFALLQPGRKPSSSLVQRASACSSRRGHRAPALRCIRAHGIDVSTGCSTSARPGGNRSDERRARRITPKMTSPSELDNWCDVVVRRERPRACSGAARVAGAGEISSQSLRSDNRSLPDRAGAVWTSSAPPDFGAARPGDGSTGSEVAITSWKSALRTASRSGLHFVPAPSGRQQ